MIGHAVGCRIHEVVRELVAQPIGCRGPARCRFPVTQRSREFRTGPQLLVPQRDERSRPWNPANDVRMARASSK
jgi:hypothetical protein